MQSGWAGRSQWAARRWAARGVSGVRATSRGGRVRSVKTDERERRWAAWTDGCALTRAVWTMFVCRLPDSHCSPLGVSVTVIHSTLRRDLVCRSTDTDRSRRGRRDEKGLRVPGLNRWLLWWPQLMAERPSSPLGSVLTWRLWLLPVQEEQETCSYPVHSA